MISWCDHQIANPINEPWPNNFFNRVNYRIFET